MPDNLTSLHAPRRFGEAFQALALDEHALDRTHRPTAFSLLDLLGLEAPQTTVSEDVAVVHVEGPLDTRGSWCWDGYDTVEERVREALASSDVRAVVLALDSPGGMAAGMLDGARALRRAADEAGKPLVAWAGTMACSAAYGLACAADAIVVTEDGEVGSVGCVARVYDRTKQNEQDGLNVKVVRSGSLKAEPHPDLPLTDAAVARVRAQVMELATMFAAYVAARRPQCGDPLTHQGAAFMGRKAVETGFADSVGTLADAITTARQMAAEREAMNQKTDTPTPGAVALATLRADLASALGLDLSSNTSDAELLASVSALRVRASQGDATAKELAEARAQLAAREAADKAAAREKVLAKHRDRGALTPAMEADASFAADLAPLAADALDRVLARLPGLPTQPVTPRKVEAIDPARTTVESVDLTDAELRFAASVGLSPDALRAQKKADAARAA